ncbi:MAG TPA: 2-oxoacid:acceptor oxidoreductase family protein [bacterium]|nr:2-oxoacid:acceptor oxidoreductase family protein [bacterium]
MARSVLIVGVGGQGAVLAGNILGEVAMGAGFQVKKSEVHGMSKRGGIVFSHVRYGPEVHSPLIGAGEADALVAFEWAEGLRWLPYLRPDGILVVDTAQILPPAAQRDHRAWARAYPELDPTLLEGHRGPVLAADARGLAQHLGSPHAANTVLLGILSLRLEFPPEAWETAIRRQVPPRTVEMNLRAFREGRDLKPAALPTGTGRWAPPAGGGAYRIEITSPWCKACDICVRVCPEACLRLGESGTVEVAASDACTGCRLCEWLCPDFAIAVHPAAPVRGGTS